MNNKLDITDIRKLKWLKNMGVDYYYSHNKDHKKLLSEKSYLDLNHSIASNISNSQSNIISDDSLNITNNQIVNNEININKDNKDNKLKHTNTQMPEYKSLKEINSLDDLKYFVNNKINCSLKLIANNTVFADGNKNANIMLIGEAPGATEDEQGIPFCGESGRLLDEIFKSINFTREKNLYITNSVFWRPPANRKPNKAEIEVCKAAVEKHIALIKPKLVILVGSTAVAAVLGKDVDYNNLRTDFVKYNNIFLDNHDIYLTAIFHPAYLLRQPSKKKESWFKMLEIEDFMKNIVNL